MGKYQKYVEDLKSLQDDVAGLRRVLHDAIQHTLQDVLRIREWVVEQERKLCPDAMIFFEVSDLFKSRF